LYTKFCHLHIHSKFSILDGMCKFDELIEAARNNNMIAMALTDHGNMYGVVEFAGTMAKSGIKPIIGLETYVVEDVKKNTREKGHLVLLVKNETGYKNLIKIASFAFTDGFYYKPSVDKKFLFEHSAGLIAMSSCMQGEVPSKVINNDMSGAKEAAVWYQKTFGEGNYYLELQNHGIEEQVIANRGLRQLSKDLSIPLTATNDVHYMKKDDDKAHEILVCIQTGQMLKTENRMRFSSKEFYFKTQAEMKAALPEDEAALYTTFEIANKCNFELAIGKKYHMPAYQVAGQIATSKEEYDSQLEKVAGEALFKKYKNITKEVQERFNHEIKVIKDLGYSGYFLIVMDIIAHARANGIPVGPGRGSAAGSLVSYVLGITGLDPMKYGLLFERFLNPSRVSPPDIDIDFSDEERGKVIEYIVNKFGKDKVAQIITFQTLKARQSIRDVGRVLDVPLKDVDALAKKVPETLNITFDQVLKDPGFAQFAASNPLYEEVVSNAIRIEGLLRQGSTHAAGVVIAPAPLTEFAPIAVPDDEDKSDLKQMTQYPMESLDKIGLLKFDILGLRNLSVIKNTLAAVKENTGKDVQLESEGFDNPEVYRLLASGETSGVFQLESEGMKDLLKKMQPTVFEEIIAIISLFRPGPMQYIDDYIKAKKGLQKVKYDFPELESVLKETYGIAIYQEQVMEIAVRIAGFTMAEADNLRRAMSKKKVSEMSKIRRDFIAGAAKKSINSEKAEALFEKLDQFSQYGFNKSHAAAYAVLSYQTAYLKALYSGEYMAALLTSVMDKIDKSAFYVTDCRKMGIKITPPDVNRSDVTFKFGRNMIVYGLAAVKHVGLSAAEEIVKQRKEKGDYKDLQDFCDRVSLRSVNSKTIESLIKGGAFDFTLLKRSQLMEMVEAAMKQGEKAQKEFLQGQGALFEEAADNRKLPQVAEYPESQLLVFEKEVLGTYISSHPLTKYEKLLRNVATPIKELLARPPDESGMVITGGVVQRLKSKITARNEERLNFYLEDLEAEIWVFVNEKLTREKHEFFRDNEMFMARGRLSYFEDKQVLHLESIISFDDAYEKLGKFLHLKVRELGMEEMTMKEINNVLAGHKGENTQVIMHVMTKDNKELILTLGAENNVKISEELLKQMGTVVGEENMWLSWKK
jgi:DNA polymerase-3 subunit alpha